MEPRPIPPFYAVYLLRSIHRHASLYVGSTPNPRRRLAQHNSEKSKTAQTRRGRPWEMLCLVHGFPSSIAALQFEWTWQNPHLTRRITPEERITTPGIATGYSRSGKPRKRPTRPRIGLKDRLANLYLLLRVPSFSRWPLQVRFFDEEVYKVWTSKVIDSNANHVRAVLDLAVTQAADSASAEVQDNQSLSKRKRQKKADEDALLSAAANVVSQGGVEGLDVSYKSLRSALQKARFVLADGEAVQCAVCAGDIAQKELNSALLCPNRECSATSHLTCLSKHFLDCEHRTSNQPAKSIIPKGGACPSCGETLQWVDLVSALTLRLRDSKMIDEILEPRKGRRKKDTETGPDWKTQMVVLDSEEDDEVPDVRMFSEVDDQEDDFEHDEPGVSDDDEIETFRPEEVVDEPSLHVSAQQDSPATASAARSGPSNPRPTFRMPRGVAVVEDSDEEASV